MSILNSEIFDPITFPELSGEDAKLLAYIRKRGGRITARELAKCRRIYRPADKAEAALFRLVRAGKGIWTERRTKGRSADEFRYLDWKTGETVAGSAGILS